MKKFLVGLLCILCLFGCSRNKANDKDISINIKIVDEISDEELFNGTLNTKAETLADALEAAKVAMASADVTMIPQTWVELTSEDDIKKMNSILDLLDEEDDVQNVYHNWDE